MRSRGGLGTHWMLPSVVRFSDPKALNPRDARRETLTSHAVKDIIRELHVDIDSGEAREETVTSRIIDSEEKIKVVKAWVKEDYKTWYKMIDKIKYPGSDSSRVTMPDGETLTP